MKKRFAILLTLLAALLLCGCGKRDDEHTLHIAAAFHTSELDALVEQFNATHSGYTAVVDYYPENAYDRLCTELLSGDGPDVLNLYGLSFPMDSPHLEDLYPYIDADTALERGTFVPAVLSSLEINGALRSLPATYEVTTLTAKTADVGDAAHWTFAQMQDILSRQGDNIPLLPESWTQTEFLRWIANISTGTFMDWQTRTAHYDTAAFQEQLQFCALLPETNLTKEPPSYQSALVQLQMIQNTLILQTIAALYDQPFTFIGFPTESGNGSFFESTTLHLGISSASDKKELAWDFIRSALTKEYQQGLAERWYFSVRGDVLEMQLRGEVTPALPEDTTEEPLDEALIAQYRQLVSQPLMFIGYNEAVSRIILEEADTYFSGRRTVEETAARIQNRVTLYLSELG